MAQIKVLDCTLRDGGYINNWDFGYDCIQNVLAKLNSTKMDIIEVGFLDETVEFSKDCTKYPSVACMDEIIGNREKYTSELVAMIMLGKFSADKLPPKSESHLDGIRVCFKKSKIDEAIVYCKKVLEKGYDLYLQPASVTDYSDEDMEYLVNKANELDVKAFYIVDTYGLMQKKDVHRYYNIIDRFLKPLVSIGFHSHNNLQLSFSNTQEMFDLQTNRDIYIDSSVFGMGRGAGNLCTELVAKYVNDNKNGSYDMIPILEIIDENITPLFKRYSWGYSVAYYVAAINSCHPDYATYLVNKQVMGVKDINRILASIPEDKKRNYNKNLIDELYLQHQSYQVDDENDKEKIKKLISSKDVLVLAPGKSVKSNRKEIEALVEDKKPLVISVNFVPDDYKADIIFISNIKRFNEIMHMHKIDESANVVVTSNISDENNFIHINYLSLINENYTEMDNSGVMLIRLLKNLDVKKVYLAGFDGFVSDNRERYYTTSMVYSIESEVLIAKNESIKKQLNELRKDMDISFITPSIYNE